MGRPADLVVDSGRTANTEAASAAMATGVAATMSECISHHLACECREALYAELKAEVDQLRARVAQLEGRDPLDVFRPEGA